MSRVCLPTQSSMPPCSSSYCDSYSRADRGMLPCGGASCADITTHTSVGPTANGAGNMRMEPHQYTLGKRVRDGETEESLKSFSQALCAHFLDDTSPATTVSSASTTATAAELFQHCLDQAAEVAGGGPAPTRYSPMSGYGPPAAGFSCGVTYTTPPALFGVSAPWANPAPAAPQLHAYRAPQLPCHQEYLNLISPLKRRRNMYGASAGMPAALSLGDQRFPNGPTARRINVVDDALLVVCQEQAQIQLSKVPPETQLFQVSVAPLACASLTTARQPGPSAQHISCSASSSSQVLDGITRWMHTLQINNPEIAQFAFHLWTRVAPSVVHQFKLSACAVVSGCLWIALKLMEHRLAVPSATNMAKIARVLPREVKMAEAHVMAWVDWAPLSHWKKL